MPPTFTGTWKADLTRTRLVGSHLKEIVSKIDHAEPMASVDMFFTPADIAPHPTEFNSIAVRAGRLRVSSRTKNIATSCWK